MTVRKSAIVGMGFDSQLRESNNTLANSWLDDDQQPQTIRQVLRQMLSMAKAEEPHCTSCRCSKAIIRIDAEALAYARRMALLDPPVPPSEVRAAREAIDRARRAGEFEVPQPRPRRKRRRK